MKAFKTFTLIYLGSILSLCAEDEEAKIIDKQVSDETIYKQLSNHGYDYNSVSINEEVPPTFTPYLGDFTQYEKMAENSGAYIKVGGHDNENSLTTNGVYSGEVEVYEDGASRHDDPMYTYDKPLVLEGDIYLNGPVVIKSDVIVKDVVIHGSGVLFSERNVHIMGNVVSDRTPYYNKRKIEQVGDTSVTSKEGDVDYWWQDVKVDGQRVYNSNGQRQQEKVKRTSNETYTSKDYIPVMYGDDGVIAECQDNNEKGAIAFAAKGNVMLGDIREYERHFSDDLDNEPYAVHSSDSLIGYEMLDGKWHGNYGTFEGDINNDGKQNNGESFALRPGIQTLGEGGDQSVGKQNNNMLRVGKVKNEGKNNEKFEGIDWDDYVSDGTYVAIYDVNDPSLEYDTNGKVILKPEMMYSVELVAGQSGNVKVREGLSDFDDNSDLRVVVPDPQNPVPKKYFEPTLSDLEILAHSKNLLEKQNNGGIGRIDAIMFTNHMFGGLVNDVVFNGAMISHNRGLRAQKTRSFYDIRAKNSQIRHYLPKAMQGPRTVYRKEF